ncbi:EscU/YscU/HrcU family type III secretion system export apparatus switch protein [Thalassospira sp. TSL5-1]|uniref:EscU/YscU/HrcU family type III secretion system export apparatus switch protein n=1 Tax=Thalassospira sp. TSL5-1 TaxID=1544451 RepID=UPI00093C1BCB|nr:EscU/YscU/HrcU family type III secretion system export apparatus switch protein [Thalassospira sp. TSL5-1]OKH89042.1 flagellar biosynthesis protein FlhB [Thalassospira sp. TSL5-1]
MTGKKSSIDLLAERNGPDGEKLAAPGRKDQVAVALRYQQGRDDAPILAAKGQGGVAEQILQMAFAKGIRVRQDSDLAEILMAVDVDSEIPLEAFAAVAEILNYIYRINQIYGTQNRTAPTENDTISRLMTDEKLQEPPHDA